ncbi:Xylosidase [Phytophthora megakarya]|uniref:Xylosidase n=1 Tax=Phytophthora megakarya TaxID=4795 RepID=A0A225WPR0_9STRA|nr:Xylosidase [Phytophthora megakarya]
MWQVGWFLLVLGVCTDSSYVDNVCDDSKVASLPFCDGSLALDSRVDDLVSRIPLDQGVGLLVNKAEAAPSVKIPSYEWWNEALHGVALSPGVTFKGPITAATSFPQVLSTAASFNRSLFYQVADVISTEARAFYNAKEAGLTFWTPNVNIFRDPRWGRGQETPGEDPYLTGEYAVAFVRGLQGEAMEGRENGQNSQFLKISSCCKHFSAYSQEVPRHRNNAMVTKQDQADTYFPAFEDCIKRGHVSSIMCSYNAVNGIPSCADKELLTNVVRGQWKFDGYITSDCEAVADVIYRHHFTQSPEQTCASTLDAGMDLNCGEFLKLHLPSAVEQGIVTTEMIHSALKNQFRVLMRLGMFEKGKQPFANVTKDTVDTTAHRQLALEAARQSIVLLKNDHNTLPLAKNDFTKDGSLALVGPHFNASTVLLGNYFGNPSHIITPLDGISHVAVAKKADRLIVFVGLDQSQEREEIDRYHLQLPGFQIALLKRILDVVSKPIVLVIISGGSVDLSVYKNHPKIGAIVFGGYLGQAGGQALADVLFGKYHPAGRLSQTFYDSDYVNVMSIYDMHMRPTFSTGNPGRSYRFFTGTPVYEFGFGLSYTTFHKTWSVEPPSELDVQSLTQRLNRNAAVESHSCVAAFEITVQNLGEISGEEVILIYAKAPHAGEGGRPLKSLVAFDRTSMIAARQNATAKFCLEAKVFALANEDGNWVVEAGNWTIQIDNLQHKVNVQESVLVESSAIAENVTRKPLPRGAVWE